MARPQSACPAHIPLCVLLLWPEAYHNVRSYCLFANSLKLLILRFCFHHCLWFCSYAR